VPRPKVGIGDLDKRNQAVRRNGESGRRSPWRWAVRASTVLTRESTTSSA
jgi:hypothetical protein